MQDIENTVKFAIHEDVGSGDLTAQLVPDEPVDAVVISRQEARLCGTQWFDEVFRQLDPQIQVEWQVTDGEDIFPHQSLCTLSGNSRAILTGERSALNFLQTLSGTATATREYVTLVSGTTSVILDTRKTLPCLRNAQKYAVTCGGGKNHRIGLYDGVLLKENHIIAAGSIKSALEQAKLRYSEVPIEIEVESLNELEQAIDAGSTRILLDNMSLYDLSAAVKLTAGRAKLEASGGINVETVAAIAATGVDFISVGELTKNVLAVDFSMRFSTTTSHD